MTSVARAAVIRQLHAPWEVTTLDLDEPRQGELRIRMVASGLCHSDHHYTTGGLPAPLWPICGGHEGAGIVDGIGPATPDWELGDHVVLSFIPSCGRCRFCAAGQQNLCGSGHRIPSGARADGSFRLHEHGVPVGQASGISTFANYSVVSADSAVKVSSDVPLDKACLVGCGVATGFGSAVNSANVRAGDTVIVTGVGGIGMNAVQGAAIAGATRVVAIDPVEFKREMAMEFGATHTFPSYADASEFVKSVTDGQGADSAIVCIGDTNGDHIADAFAAIRKGGTVVMTGIGDWATEGIPVSPTQMTLFQKRLQGSLYGEMSPGRDIPRLLDMYSAGTLKLDELVTKTYTLDQINDGWADMQAGRNIRGVIIHEH